MDFEAQDSAAKRNDAQAKEDIVLLKAGFKRTESDLLWKRNSVLYGRQAALQVAFKEREREREREAHSVRLCSSRRRDKT